MVDLIRNLIRMLCEVLRGFDGLLLYAACGILFRLGSGIWRMRVGTCFFPGRGPQHAKRNHEH